MKLQEMRCEYPSPKSPELKEREYLMELRCLSLVTGDPELWTWREQIEALQVSRVAIVFS